MLYRVLSVAFALLLATTLQAEKNKTIPQLAPSKEQVFTRQILSEPASIDPQLVEETAGNDIARDLFEGLYSIDKNGEISLAGAVGYNVSAQGDVYTFNLRTSAKWSNGDPVRAQDYVYGWQRVVDPKTGSNYASYLDLMNVQNAQAIIDGKAKPETLGIKAIEEFTLQVTLNKPTPYFLKTLTYPSTFPAPQKVIEKYGRDWVKPENIVSNGAFKLEKWIPNEKITLVRNNNYWDQSSIILEKVHYLMISSQQAAYNRYRAGELDYGVFPENLYTKIKKESPSALVNDPLLGTYYYGFNTTKKPFNDVRVRQALSLAVDRDIIVDKVLGQGQLPAYSFVPPYTDGFVHQSPAQSMLTQKERIKKAQDLLSQAGYGPKNPLRFELVYNTSESHKKIAVAVANMWKQSLGVRVILNNMEWKTMLSRLQTGDFDMYRSGWVADYNDGMTFLDVFDGGSSQNNTKWNNAIYNRYLDEAKKTLDTNKRNQIYHQAEQLIIKEAPIIPIYFYVKARFLNVKVKGYPYGNPFDLLYSKDLYVVN